MNKRMTAIISSNPRECIVFQQFGAEAVTYLRRKHTGGVSGEKGTRYEDLFAVTLIAEQAYRLNGLCDGVNLEAQAPMYFVDDLVVREDGNTIEQCFQLKNSPNIIWGRGKKSITDDFERQLVISKAAGLPPPKIALVTSDAKCSASLQATIPASLSGAAEVRWFPWAETTNLLCYTWPETMKAIAWLSKHESPNAQELSEVLTILLGVWAARGGNARTPRRPRRLRATHVNPPVCSR